MVHRLVVSYGQPEDPDLFDTYYRDTHAPLALQQPGLIGLTFGHATPLDRSQPGPYLVAELDFESAEAMRAALSSPEGRATGADLANFVTGGVTFAHFDVQTVR